MNNTNNALETLVQRDKQIKKTTDKLKASINELDAELETTTNALSTHASNTNIHTSKEELIQLIVDHLESLDLGITKEVVSVLPTEDISDNTLYFVPNDKGSHNEYLYINDKWELVGSTETNLTDYYTKLETNTLLEDKANSVHSHVVNDITDFPTIPTKVSDLTNDSGYITGVAWGDITSKPNFSTVATSGSYTDLSNTPTIPTKLSQLENDMGFGTGGDTSDCVHKTGDETIAGTKTFSARIISNKELHYKDTLYDWSNTSLNTWCNAGHVSWFDKTGNRRMHELVGANGGVWKKSCYINENQYFSVDSNRNISFWGSTTFFDSVTFAHVVYSKNNFVDLSVTPTKYHVNHNYVFMDKNNVPMGHIEYCQRPTGVNDIGIFARDKNGVAHGIHINTSNEVIPLMSSSESYSLGSSSYKWGKIYSNDVVHTTGNETINGAKTFTNDIFYKNSNLDLTITPTSNTYANFIFRDKNNKTLGYLQYGKQTTGNGVIGIYLYDSSQTLHGLQVTSDNHILPLTNNAYSLGASARKLLSVYATTFNGNLKGNVTGNCSGSSSSCTGNSASATKASYLDNYSNAGGNKIYLDWDNQVKSYVGLKVDNTTMGGLITTNNIGSQTAKSATYSTTPATTDNSTRIATTAWVRTYVDSVAGSNTVGSSVSAYWSNSSNVTATGQASSGGYYPACYSEYITKTPVVGTIYSGAQLYIVLNTYAYAKSSTTGSSSSPIYVTNNTAQATFSSPISATGKYLCTTANTVKFRAYTAQGSSSAVGTSSVVNNSSAKSIFIRVQ